MDDSTAIFLIILIVVVLLVALGQWIYYSFFAPCYRSKVKVVSKGFAPNMSPVLFKRGLNRLIPGNHVPTNFYWAEFQTTETDALIKLGMDLDLYTDIKEGQRGILTYRKGYALTFQRIGKLKKRKPSLGEKTFGFFSRKL